MNWVRGVRGLALLGGGLFLIICIGLSLHVSGQYNIGTPARVAVFVALALLACVIYGVAVAAVMKKRLPGAGIIVVLVVALAVRMVVLVAPPFLSTDLFRYVWDGRVQIAGINPYLYPPAAPELSALRDDAIFSNINRPDYARTIYPPVAQMIFRLIATVWPSTYGIKTTMFVFDVVTIALLLRLLHQLGRPPAQVLIYAWHPLPVWEFAGSGHIDAAAVCFVAAALLAAASMRPKTAAVALAMATLVKLLPMVLFPVIWRRWDWATALVFAACIAACYFCYLGAGWHVFGFLPGYATEEGAAGGNRIYGLALLSQSLGTLPSWAGVAYLGTLALALLTLGAFIALSERKLAGAALLLATSLIVGLSPHYPWYFVWLLVPCCLLPCLSIIYLTTSVFLIYLASYDSTLIWASLIYIPFFLFAGIDLFRFRRSFPSFGPNHPRSAQCL